jgi:hypothetical protein
MRQRFEHFGKQLEHAREEFEKVKEAEVLTSELLD